MACRNREFEGNVLNSLLEVLILVMVVLENMDAPTMEVVPNVSITSNLENVSLASKEVPINPP